MLTWPERIITLFCLVVAIVTISWLLGERLLMKERLGHLLADVFNLRAELGALRLFKNVVLGPVYSDAPRTESGGDAYNRLMVEELSKLVGPASVEVGDPWLSPGSLRDGWTRYPGGNWHS